MMNCQDSLSYDNHFAEMDEAFSLSFTNKELNVPDLEECPPLSFWENVDFEMPSISDDDSETQKRERDDIEDQAIASNRAWLDEFLRETPWELHHPDKDTPRERAERVFKLLEGDADLHPLDKIKRASHKNRLVVWLDFPQDTPKEKLNKFEVSRNDSGGMLGFYGAVCPDGEFDPSGKLFFTMFNAERRYKGRYQWNKVEVVQLYKQTSDRAQKKRRTDE